MNITMEPLACKLCGERFITFDDMRSQYQTFGHLHRLICAACNRAVWDAEMQAERDQEAWEAAGCPEGRYWRQ